VAPPAVIRRPFVVLVPPWSLKSYILHESILWSKHATSLIRVVSVSVISWLKLSSKWFWRTQSDDLKLIVYTTSRTFIDMITSPEYMRRVPPKSSSYSAFDINRSITKIIVDSTHVYRKTQGRAKIPLALYENLLADGLIEEPPLPPAKKGQSYKPPTFFKYLPVRMWRHSTSASSKKATYCYTVISKLPKHSGVATEVPRGSPAYKSKALRKDSNFPDLGISSFYYLLQSALFESRQRGRPAKAKSGQVGKPHKLAVPSFLERQAEVDRVYGTAKVPDALVRAAEGRLEDEEDESEVLQ
jgi:hypothetical protein